MNASPRRSVVGFARRLGGLRKRRVLKQRRQLRFFFFFDAVSFQGLVDHLVTTTAQEQVPGLLQDMFSCVFARVAEVAIEQTGGQVEDVQKKCEHLLIW